MATNFPTTIDTTTTIPVEASGTALAINHVTNHTNMRDSILAIEAKVGVNSSATTTSHDYKLSEVTGSDKAVGKTATQTLTNKTLTSPVINVTSDATGDIYYRNSGGLLTRLPVGSIGQVLTVASGLPSYATPASLTDASYAAKGAVQGLTDAATSGLTISSGVISVNSGTTANKILKLDASAKIPAVDGSLVTGVNPMVSMVLTVSSGVTTTTVTHSLGVIPRYAYIRGVAVYTTGSCAVSGFVQFNNSTGAVIRQNSSGYNFDSNGSVISFQTSSSAGYIVRGSSTTNTGSFGTTTSTSLTLTHSVATSGGFDLYIEFYA